MKTQIWFYINLSVSQNSYAFCLRALLKLFRPSAVSFSLCFIYKYQLNLQSLAQRSLVQKILEVENRLHEARCPVSVCSAVSPEATDFC